jgi:hypothetical protein
MNTPNSYNDIYHQWRNTLVDLPTDRQIPTLSGAMKEEIDTLIDVTQSLLLELNEADITHKHGHRIGEILHIVRVMNAMLTAANSTEEEKAQARICA